MNVKLWLRLWRHVLWSYLSPQRGPWARPHNPELHETNARLCSVEDQLRQRETAQQADASRLWVDAQTDVRGRGHVELP
jgi:hypothetical protein